MFSEEDKFLHGVYDQLPLGVSIDDRSEIKRYVDKLLNDGVTDIYQYFIDNPDELYDLVMSIKLIDVNKAMLNLYKVATVEEYHVFDADFDSWKDSEWKEFYSQEIASMAEGKTYKGEYREFVADGSSVEISCISQPLSGHEDDWSRVIATHEDISKRKRAEEEIRILRDELEKLNAQKDEFLAIIAHDLKSPFNTLMAYSQILMDRSGGLSEEEVHEYSEYLHASANQAYKFVEDLLDWALTQFDRATFEPGPCDLRQIINDNLERYKSEANVKNIEITLDTSQTIMAHADAHMIDTIFRNLISNAIKFSNDSGTIKINMQACDKMVDIRFADDGIGMTDKKLQRLFRLDQKVQSKGTRGETGTGFGLHLCKKMAELNGGLVHAESIEGEGSTFCVTLPLS